MAIPPDEDWPMPEDARDALLDLLRDYRAEIDSALAQEGIALDLEDLLAREDALERFLLAVSALSEKVRAVVLERLAGRFRLDRWQGGFEPPEEDV